MEPGDTGIDLIENDFRTEVVNMIKNAKELGNDEPFCLLNMDMVVQQFKLWKETFPAIRPFFAVKAHGDPVVIKLLAQLGAGFECSSKCEMELVQSLGVVADDIVFANPIKIPSHLAYAAEQEVSLMTFDTLDELHKIKRLYPQARLLLRICPVEDEHVRNVEVAFSQTFGASLRDVPDILIAARQLDLSIIGVAFHAGSGCGNVKHFIKHIECSRMVFDMAEEHGIQMAILDIGGGFLGSEKAKEVFLKMSGPIKKCIAEMFPDVTVISEPGRFFVESAMTLATSVIGKRSYRKEGSPDKCDFVVSASACAILNRGLMLSKAYQEFRYNPILALREPVTRTNNFCNLKGPTSMPEDIIFCCNVPELEIGDWLIFEEVGTYTISFAVAFNGFPIPPVRRVMTKSIGEAGFVKTFF